MKPLNRYQLDETKKAYRLDPHKFIELWQASSTIEEAADKIGDTPKRIRIRASYLRIWWQADLQYLGSNTRRAQQKGE